MRILVAVGIVASLSACFAGGEPLSSTRIERNRNVTNETGSGTQDRAPLSIRDQAIADLAAAVHDVSLKAYASAEAGRAHDRLAAENAAFELAQAADVVNSRAFEVQSIDNENAAPASGDCGCEPCASEPVQSDPDVDNAVVVSALSVEAGDAISNDLNNVQDTTSCTQSCGCEGCDEVCTTVPGNVDEGQLDGDIQEATEDGAAADDAGDVLAGSVAPV